MSTKGIVDALNRQSVTAIVRLLNIIFPPIVIYIGTVFIDKANTVIALQEKFNKTQEIHAARLASDSTSIAKLFRHDRLFGVKQEAMRDALQVNPTIGKIFTIDYDTKYSDKLNESNFLNP